MMAGQQERDQLIRELVSKMHIDSDQAAKTLFMNNWDIVDSEAYLRKIHGTPGSRIPGHNSSHHTAVDVGLGAAVNLTTKPVPLPKPRVTLTQPITSQTVHMPASSQPYKQPQHDRPPPGYYQATRQPQAYPTRTSQYQYSGHPPAYSSHAQQQHHSVPGSQVPEPAAPNNVSRHETQPAEDEEDDVFDIDHKSPGRRPPLSGIPRLKRGFSNILENEGLVFEARHNVEADIRHESHDMYAQTFLLPDLDSFEDDFRAFIGRELIEASTLVALEQAGRLNWWAELRLSQRLLPMATSGDGNCLLHAASLAMWGIHDRQLILRKELNETLTRASYKDALYRRWRLQQTIINKQSGLVFSEAEWQEEWKNILRLASPQPRGANFVDGTANQGQDDPVTYESLEEFHVFVLAHVIRRPIIIVADTVLRDTRGEALAPIPFPGIYLPLELKPGYRSPLMLTYDAAHFSALAPTELGSSSSSKLTDPGLVIDRCGNNLYKILEEEATLSAAIPLVDPDLQLLPLHFHTDPGPNVDWTKFTPTEPSAQLKVKSLKEYLDVEWLALPTSVVGETNSSWDSDKESDDVSSVGSGGGKKSGGAVARQFNSLGRSVGRKLRQLGGKVGKAGHHNNHQPLHNQPDSGVITNTYTAIPPNSYIGSVGPGSTVMVARLSSQRSPQQQKMVSNYLANARERFEASGPSIVDNSSNNLSRNLGGSSGGSHNKLEPPSGRFVYNTFPGRIRGGQAQEDVYIYGKSCFYTSSNEDVRQAGVTENKGSEWGKDSGFGKVVGPSKDRVGQARGGGVVSVNNYDRKSSPPPDYDNLGYQMPQPCLTRDCSFYGNRASGGLCSKCFQQTQQRNINATKL